ncbi:tRNA (adenosine(37)-N6)-threonylcarbamoyltransferase complex ATPase subunit type 1 TsaE [Methylacidiphilum caldifontis]|uniref:tRNA threonylcarbamoyladenosine biosynthesis protein TsaE n=1 Tax=Methylacidiphilum caldifontis TaxID=2795386 RepID=A0A4Y8PDP4_9BACT|nr:tRNA (adenosine(37)-N6)-threonylcarbamoyltransferase complex ATPase subunit type 1 TsaE [Methylacidiphilum caldifontis]QSR88088.1 tRNA (adenosine(37)-N6)-threonylcarbamoyltransferase complex ATPase subunit type 1 TsaE [Methylacidiphilum caldifontis]TFE69623.1 tRNA (N6-adenosine(37)-N6)-threonylcarbamoyltransferase complex ATPase TsaE [Methylacidiphilum caldifontis]
MNSEVSIISRSPKETIEFGKSLVQDARGGEVFALIGELGAGKTQIVKGAAIALGIEAEVTSPTFNIVHCYEAKNKTLYHIDLYRIEKLEGSLRLYIEEILHSKEICFIEWPGSIEQLLPPWTQYWQISIISENERKIIRLR